ncbi:Actin-binding protein IPP [Holothuria leucospilota]|uniref:Actin-binding protein IPP n=1 Tax=Holothuria leucospilota TaxID=206669 RepID=A0A9Q1H8Q2_HOLLE|nr:Actin-binding protein IPP [Holothuria leucospilota]
MSVQKDSEGSVEHVSIQHCQSLVRGLHKLLRQDYFTDVTIKAGKREIKAHRLILSAASPYFEAMFMSGLREKDQEVVEIHSVKETHLHLLVEFIYSGKIFIDSENVQELLTAADMLQISEVVDACCDFLKKELHPRNCIGVMELADAFSRIDLSGSAQAFCERNFIEVVKEEEFLGLPLESLTKLLQSEFLCIEQEFQVFEAGLRWILHNPSERRQCLLQIMECVRFPLIQPGKLFGQIESCEDFSLKIALKKLLQDFEPKKQRSSSRTPYSKFRTGIKPRHNARKYLVILGGYHRAKSGRWHDVRPLADVFRFDSFNRMWTPYPNIQYPRSGLSAVFVQGFLYTIGGENELLLYDNVEVLDPLEMKWTNGPSLPRPLSGHKACVLDGFIYVFGGYVGSEVTDSVIRLDPEEGKWKQVGCMPSKKTNFALTEVEGLVYIAGGSSDSGGERSLQCYNPVTEEWTQLAPMKHSRGSCGLAAIGNCIYAVGGSKPGRDAMSSVESYSIEENKWTTVKSMRIARADPCVASINGLLFVVGGRSAGQGHSPPHTLDDMESYNPETNEWTAEDPIPVHRCDAGVVIT